MVSCKFFINDRLISKLTLINRWTLLQDMYLAVCPQLNLELVRSLKGQWPVHQVKIDWVESVAVTT